MIILMYFCERNLTSSSRVSFITVSEICIQRTRLAFVVVHPTHFRLVSPPRQLFWHSWIVVMGGPNFRQGVSVVEANKKWWNSFLSEVHCVCIKIKSFTKLSPDRFLWRMETLSLSKSLNKPGFRVKSWFNSSMLTASPHPQRDFPQWFVVPSKRIET